MPKDVTRTIRIDQQTEQVIRRLALERDTSVNFLANQAIKTFVEWHTVAQKLGLCCIPRSLLNKLVEQIDENGCQELGRWVAREAVKPFAEYLFDELTAETVIKTLKKFGQYGGRFEFEESETTRSNTRTLLLKHQSGRKWSIYYASLIDAIFNDILHKKVKTDFTEELCIARVEL